MHDRIEGAIRFDTDRIAVPLTPPVDTPSRRSYNFFVKKAARTQVTFELVRRTALSLPNVQEGTAYGYPAFRTAGKVFLTFRKDFDSIAVRTDFDQRDEMIEASPATYHTTDHHRPYPWVLARIGNLDPAVLPDLLRMGWSRVRKDKR